jgi:hypothetical protein
MEAPSFIKGTVDEIKKCLYSKHVDLRFVFPPLSFCTVIGLVWGGWHAMRIYDAHALQ